MRLQTGQILDGLRVLGTLGEGATSQVYLVADSSAGGEMRALKLLSVVGKNTRERLHRESEAIRLTRHPNVVSVHRMVEHDGMTGILMEFVAGPTVHRWLQTAEPPLEECLAVAVGVLRGLQAIHGNELVHRDIKPSNILLANVGDAPIRPRLLDFGLVKHLKNEGRLTRTGVSMGTPAYMAPEQLRDASKVDHRADLYSFGCVLFEMIAGARPFVRDEWWDAYRHIEDGARVEMNRLPPDTPEHVCTTLRALLQPDPNDRPQTAEQAIAMLTAPYPPEHPVHTGTLFPTDFGGRVARGLALVQRDALRPQDLAEGVLAEVPTNHLESLNPTMVSDRRPWSARQRLVVGLLGTALVALLVAIGVVRIFPPGRSSAPGLPAAGLHAAGPPTTGLVREDPLDADAEGGAPGRDAEPAAGGTSVGEGDVGDGGVGDGGVGDGDVGDGGVGDGDVGDGDVVSTAGGDRRAGSGSDPNAAGARADTQPSGTASPTPARAVAPVWGPTADTPGSRDDTAEAQPTGRPDPSDAEAPAATVDLAGDAADVRLAGPGGARFAVDEPLPAGNYTIEVRWQPGDGYVPSGQVELDPGQRTTITCQRAFFQCRS